MARNKSKTDGGRVLQAVLLTVGLALATALGCSMAVAVLEYVDSGLLERPSVSGIFYVIALAVQSIIAWPLLYAVMYGPAALPGHVLHVMTYRAATGKLTTRKAHMWYGLAAGIVSCALFLGCLVLLSLVTGSGFDARFKPGMLTATCIGMVATYSLVAPVLHKATQPQPTSAAATAAVSDNAAPNNTPASNAALQAGSSAAQPDQQPGDATSPHVAATVGGRPVNESAGQAQPKNQPSTTRIIALISMWLAAALAAPSTVTVAVYCVAEVPNMVRAIFDLGDLASWFEIVMNGVLVSQALSLLAIIVGAVLFTWKHDARIFTGGSIGMAVVTLVPFTGFVTFNAVPFAVIGAVTGIMHTRAMKRHQTSTLASPVAATAGSNTPEIDTTTGE